MNRVSIKKNAADRIKKAQSARSKIREKFKDKVKELAQKRGSTAHRSLRLRTDVSNLLYSYQRLHLVNLIAALRKHGVALDGSSTGTGKTYTAIGYCKQYNISPIILCSKSSRTTWKKVCDRFRVEPKCVVNYELMRNCKMYDENDKKVECPYLSRNEDGEYMWTFDNPKRNLIIFDEAHQCKNPKSQLGRMLEATKNTCKILLLSATLYDKINDFLIFGYLMGLYKSTNSRRSWISSGRSWIKWVKRQDTKRIGKFKHSIMYDEIFPSHGSRMDIEDLGNKFPRNTIITDCYDIDPKEAKKLNIDMEKFKRRRNRGDKLSKISKTREKIEMYKAPLIVQEICKYHEIGNSVAVFVNFLKTVKLIEKGLNRTGLDYGVIKGGQSSEERDHQQELFQHNRIKIIICTIQSGGESINLHDKFGGHPRVSLISPSLSSINIIQALGRIYRSECKTPCIQRIILCAGTYEEKVADIIKTKSKDIKKLTNDDLFNY